MARPRVHSHRATTEPRPQTQARRVSRTSQHQPTNSPSQTSVSPATVQQLPRINAFQHTIHSSRVQKTIHVRRNSPAKSALRLVTHCVYTHTLPLRGCESKPDARDVIGPWLSLAIASIPFFFSPSSRLTASVFGAPHFVPLLRDRSAISVERPRHFVTITRCAILDWPNWRKCW